MTHIPVRQQTVETRLSSGAVVVLRRLERSEKNTIKRLLGATPATSEALLDSALQMGIQIALVRVSGVPGLPDGATFRRVRHADFGEIAGVEAYDAIASACSQIASPGDVDELTKLGFIPFTVLTEEQAGKSETPHAG